MTESIFTDTFEIIIILYMINSFRPTVIKVKQQDGNLLYIEDIE